jgi:hypothetical protein
MRGGATQAMRAHCRGAPTKHMPTRRRNPLGAWGLRADLFVARRQRCACIASSSRLELGSQAPCARHVLILGHAPSYTEPHYIGFSMIKKSRSSNLVGEYPQYDLAWKVFENNNVLASGPGKFHGVYGSTIVLGSFQLIAGKTYRLEVIAGPSMAIFKPTNPVLEVGVDHAAVSVGLALQKEIDKFIFKLAAYIFLIGSILLLGIAFAAYKIQNA